MAKTTYAILMIDPQNDFVKSTGSLSVKGAEADAVRIVDFIDKNGANIDYIGITTDQHHPVHIAHATFWKDKDGKKPDPFTVITAKDYRAGAWSPQFNPPWALKYLEELEKTGRSNMIWPEHCLVFSEGAAIYKPISESVNNWERTYKRFYGVFPKGNHPFVEHFSIFKAEVPFPNAPETNVNMALLAQLNKYNVVFLCGEAATHCVANSLNDIVIETPELAKKVIVLEDCMSWIGTEAENPRAVKIFADAKAAGVQFVKSNQIVFNN
jgi:nicotinamidase-related amidase